MPSTSPANLSTVSPSTQPRLPTGALTFRQPTPNPETDPRPSSDDQLGASPSPSDAMPDEPGEPSTSPRTSSKASSGRTTTKEILRKAARALVEVVGGYANDCLARDAAAQQVQMYVADEEDQEAIGDPLAELAHRHGRMGDFASPDVADAIDAMIGLTIYAVKLLAKRKRAKELRRAHQDSTATLAAVAPDTQGS
jgi:hypothetical protein